MTKFSTELENVNSLESLQELLATAEISTKKIRGRTVSRPESSGCVKFQSIIKKFIQLCKKSTELKQALTLKNKLSELNDSANHKANEDLLQQGIKAVAALTVQTHARGWLLRKSTYLPREVRPFLQHQLIEMHGLSENEALVQTIAICREINRVLADKPQRPVRINHWPQDECIKLVNSGTPAAPLSGPVDLILDLSENSKKLTLRFQAKDVGIGGYKTVTSSQTFNLTTFPKRTEVYEDRVLKEETYSGSDPRYRIGMQTSVKKGIKKQSELWENAPASIYIAKPPEVIETTDEKALTLSQPWYGSDLDRLLRGKKLHTSLVPSEDSPVDVTRKQLLHCLRDAATATKWMNDQGHYHRDIKHANVFVSIATDAEGKTRPIGYLADFDQCSRQQGFDSRIPKGGNYPTWDPALNRHQIASPYVDRFALTWMLLEFVLLDMPGHPKNLKTLTNITKNIHDAGTPKTADAYWPEEWGKWEEIPPLHQEAWSAFCTTCLESILLYSNLKHIPGEFPQNVKAKDVLKQHKHLTSKMGSTGMPPYSLEKLISLIDKLLDS